MQHNVLFAESLVHSRYAAAVITRKEGCLADSERVCACALWADAEKRIHM